MYHFVKIEGTWYLKVEKEQDIIDHLNKISKNAITPWCNAVSMYMGLFGYTYENAIERLKENTIKSRVEFFNNGNPLYLQYGLMYKSFINPIIEDEKYMDELEFPKESIYDFDEDLNCIPDPEY